jgi:DNA replication and repair protein RecF
MRLLNLTAQNFRNFEQFELSVAPQFNLLYGENGSGKTSILEAIHFVFLARSFRISSSRRLIRKEQDKLAIFAELNQAEQPALPLGIEKKRAGEMRLKLAGNKTSVSEMAALLPIRVLNNESFYLITEGPKFRRQFLDWALFHVKPNFFSIWRRYHHVLKQRNQLLKQRARYAEIQTWDHLLAPLGEQISQMREAYIKDFYEKFIEIFSERLFDETLLMEYQRGWGHQYDYAEALKQSFSKDESMGFTTCGPHRAELSIILNGLPAADTLSRGQQKLFAWIMLVTQGQLLEQTTHKTCLYLIDDLASELDSKRKQFLGHLLMSLNSQFFITAIHQSDLTDFLESEHFKMFHVKQGTLV